MKYLFLIAFMLLCGASAAVHFSLPENRNERPVIYWVTDANPARQEQVSLFGQWLKKNNYPDIELKLDMSNNDRSKKIIQGVSGVAGDLMDMAGGSDMRYFRAMGLNADVTEDARRLGFTPDATYPALLNEITIDEGELGRRQYQMSCNASMALYVVNNNTFRQYGQPLPPRRWTVEEFEKRGIAFVNAANKGRPRQTVFFADMIDLVILRSSFGGSRYNETGTRATLDQEPNIKALRLLYDWTYKYRLLPSAADLASMTAESGYGGAKMQLYNNEDGARGQYAMLWSGRHVLIQMREFDAARKRRGEPLLDHGASEPPHGGFPNNSISTRAAMVYSGGKHRDLAVYFLAFLASDEYNLQLVKDADAMPPNPKVTELPEYLEPPDHPNEWSVHKAYAEVAKDLAIGTAYSPFLLNIIADRIENEAREKFMNNLLDAKAAGIQATEGINRQIARTLKENPRLQPLYDQLLERQARIDRLKIRLEQLRAAGLPIPEEAKIPDKWIENAYHKAYYAHLGWTK